MSKTCPVPSVDVWLRTPAAAAHLEMKKSALETIATLGLGPPYTTSGKARLYRLADLDEFKRNHPKRIGHGHQK